MSRSWPDLGQVTLDSLNYLYNIKLTSINYIILALLDYLISFNYSYLLIKLDDLIFNYPNYMIL